MKKENTIFTGYSNRHLLVVLIFFFSIFLNIEISYAGITLDGTMGQSGTLTGPSYTITDTMGTQAGGNLFHSFGTFNVYTGESATFTGSSSISNIIARVTGGTSSYIDGTISSSISGANLYFLNPAGVMFGKNATLDIKGSFYVSTADYLKLSDGGKYNATTPSDTVLTTAAPSAFGFTSSNPTGVSIDGGFLEVAEGKGITIVAGSIDIKNGYLYAPGGQINLASVASAGEASITSSGINTDALSTLGNINISHTDSTRETKNGYTIGNLDVSSTAGGSGSIYIRGGKFTLDGGYVFADTYGDTNGGGIDINIAGDINIINGSAITSDTLGKGNAGDISIKATETINISGYFDSGSGLYNSKISSATYGSGDAGSITIETGNLNLTNVGQITTVAQSGSTGNAGDITIKAADSVNISGYYDSGSGLYSSNISSETYGSGDAGSITIETDSLSLTNVGQITTVAKSASTGNAGDITIKAADSINISGYYYSGSGLYSSNISSETYGSGDASSITIETSNLNLSNVGVIYASAREGSTGNAGDITIKATEAISISGYYDSGDGVYVSSIKSETYGSGNAGNITIETGNLNLSNVGTILSYAQEGSTGKAGDISIKATETINISGYYDSGDGVYSSAIKSETYGSGDAGSITIETGNLNLSDVGTISSSTWAGSTGNGGDITIKATETINISGYYDSGSGLYASKIASETFGSGDAGNITIETGNLNLSDLGTISSSAREGSTGNGGDITIKATETINISGYYDSGNGVSTSGISSETFGRGDAGNITIETNNLNLTNVGTISSSARSGSTGNGGDITIRATDTISISGYYNSDNDIYNSKISSVTFGSGDAGSITIETGNLNLSDLGAIYATAREGSTGKGGDIMIKATEMISISGSYEFTSDIIVSSGIYSGSSGSGQGGSVSITTSNLTLTDGGTISATSTGDGNAGSITIKVSDILQMDNGDIATSSSKTTGGNITITGGDIKLLNGSSISSNVKSGKDKGGNITISAATLCVLDNSEISADADLGYGGNITIGAHAVFLWDTSALHASSSITGQEGAININSPLSDVTGSLLQLNPSYLQAEKLLPESCGARKEQRGSFVVKGTEYLSPQHSRFLF